MKSINKIFAVIAVSMTGVIASSCDSYLDTLPDNRAEIDTEDKVSSLLVSAYPSNGYQLVCEYMSDNVDDSGSSNPYTDRFLDQVYSWTDVTETNNEDPESFWEASYEAISAANQAIESIEEIEAESGNTATLTECMGEALLCRAYNHFMLVNMFAQHYNSATAASTPGITYMEHSETTLKPQYQRNSVAEVYKLIDEDLQKGLPMVGDSHLTVPKYHFNQAAAYAFACRFYLYYEQYDKAIEYANKVLGASPKSALKDYSTLGSESTFAAQSQAYISATSNGNLLLATGHSNLGLAFGPYYVYKRYSHVPYIASSEDILASHPWGRPSTSYYYTIPRSYSATNLSCTIFWRMPYLFEYTDPVAGIGYRRSVFPLLTTDETLLNRAEAYVLTKQYDKACEDINIWLSNVYKTYTAVTPQSVQTFYQGINYAYQDDLGNDKGSYLGTTKKHLHPGFDIGAEGDMEESMLQCVINARRIETLHTGLRWFDIKRYGIEIPRRLLSSQGQPISCYDWLTKDDERRAVQIPQKVVDAGYDPNTRTHTNSTTNQDVFEEIPETDTVND